MRQDRHADRNTEGAIVQDFAGEHTAHEPRYDEPEPLSNVVDGIGLDGVFLGPVRQSRHANRVTRECKDELL